MFFFATSHRFNYSLQLHTLGESEPVNPVWLAQVAKWSEDKWGYLRKFPGIDKRKELISEMKHNFYIITYANQPIATFALQDTDNDSIKKLTYVYIEESFRGLGIGVKLIDFAKDVCRRKNVEMIMLDTLTPNLDHFYERRGAKWICEDRALGHPTSLFRMGTRQ